MIKGRVNILGWEIYAHVKLSDVVSYIVRGNCIERYLAEDFILDHHPDRYSVDTHSTLDQQPIDSRPRVDRLV